MKIWYLSVTATTVWVTDLYNGVTTFYPSAKSAALMLNCSNSMNMDKLKGKPNKILKGRYSIRNNTILVEVARDS